MSDIVNFKRPTSPEPPKNRFGNDEWLLKLCVEWRVARALQRRNWAEPNLTTMWGTLPHADDLPDAQAFELTTPNAPLSPRCHLASAVTSLSTVTQTTLWRKSD
jgi:hypothetical protein